MFKTIKKSEITREKILHTALSLFRKQGFEKTTMRDIAAQTGLSLGAAYYHFASKEAIVGAYYDYVQAEHKARAEARFPESPDLRARLGVAMHTKLDILQDDRRLLAALFHYGGDPDHPLSWFGEATRRQRELSEAVFETALGNEQFPEDIRRMAPRLLWTLHMGIVLYLVFDRSRGQEKTRRLTDGALDLVVQAKRIVTNPLLRPFRKKVTVLLEDAGLLLRLGPQAG